MKSVSLNEIKVQRRARQIIKGLEDVQVNDALSIIHKVLGFVINENLKVSQPGLIETVYPFNPNLIRRHSRSKIDSDPEVKAFIHSLPEHLYLKEIAARCKKKFGKWRAPGKSAVGRYIKRLEDENKKSFTGDDNE